MTDGQPVENNGATAVAEPSVDAGQSVETAPSTLENQNGQAGSQDQGASVEETFSNIDPKTLPPELQALHKNLQADYTKKTQAIAQKAKEIAEAQKKAQAYDQLTADQRFRDYWSNLSRKEQTDFKEQKAEAEKSLGQKISDEEFAKSLETKDGFLNLLKRVVDDTRSQDQQRIQELEQSKMESEAADVVEMFASEMGPDNKPLRPDFKELDTKYNLITGYLTVNPVQERTQAAYLNKLNEAYSWAKTMTQDFYNKGKADALSAIQKKAATSTQMPTNAAKSSYAGPDPKKLTVREAIELAKRGTRIPQVYD